jgi:hypothetical protein
MTTHSEEYKGYTLRIEPDESIESPRTYYGNLGTMVCFHRRYNLGDTHNYGSDSFNGWDELEKQIIKDNDPAIILPVYMYDHSGLTISTSPFSCPCDSGQIGFIFVSKAKVRDEYGKKIVSKAIKDEVRKILEGEIETYDQYLKGEVYGWIIDAPDEKDEKNVESCWGCYGFDYCIESAKEAVDGLLQHEKNEIEKKQLNLALTAIKNRLDIIH